MRAVRLAQGAILIVFVISLAAVVGQRLGVGAPTQASTGCSLQQFHGELVADHGRVLFVNSQAGGAVPVDWGGDWTVRAADGGQLEVVDAPTGIVRARTGTQVILLTRWDPDGAAYTRDGAFVVCEVSPG